MKTHQANHFDVLKLSMDAYREEFQSSLLDALDEEGWELSRSRHHDRKAGWWRRLWFQFAIKKSLSWYGAFIIAFFGFVIGGWSRSAEPGSLLWAMEPIAAIAIFAIVTLRGLMDIIEWRKAPSDNET